MKAATVFHVVLGLFIGFSMVLSPVLAPPKARAADGDYSDSSEQYRREELAQMLAPIALYPDTLLSQVLMASTYPIEVVEADRWVKKNPGLKDEALDEALLDEDWDPSVKAVCHFPTVLSLMSERIAETTNIGNAFLGQETEVMDMVQELRAKAYAQNNLPSNAEQKVTVERDTDTIIIEPADPRFIYVPYYDPFSIYGPWWYPAYPPYYWGPPGVSIGIGISYWPGFYFGFSFGTWSYFNWHRHYIHIDAHTRPRFVRRDRWVTNPGRWDHAPVHRRGVAYHNRVTAEKYGQAPSRPVHFRRDTGGFPQVQSLDQYRRVNERNRSNLDRQARERAELKRKERERTKLDNQQRQRTDRAKPERERAESDRKERKERAGIESVPRSSEPVAVDAKKQEQRRVDRDKQERKGVEDNRRERAGIERDGSTSERADSNRENRTKTESVQSKSRQDDQGSPRQPDPDQQLLNRNAQEKRDSNGRERQPRTRDKVFKRGEEGGKERISGERGRGSRPGRGDGSEVIIEPDGNNRGRDRR